MRCAHCGAESRPDNLTLCPVCGTKLATRWQQETRCLGCGHYVNNGLHACPFCGASLRAKPGNWGVALLGLLAAAAVALSVQRYGLGREELAAVKRAPATVISTLSEWKERLFTVEWEAQ